MYTLEEGYKNGKSLTTMSKDLGIDRHVIARKLQESGCRPIPQKGFEQSTLQNPTIFDVIDTYEKAYWLGFILADGSLSKHNSLKIGLAEKDKDHIVKLQKFLPSKCRIGYNAKTKSYSYSVINKHLSQTLQSYGIIPNKSSLPMHKLPQLGIYNRSFLCGYLDGDGSVGINPATSKNGWKYPKFCINALGQKIVCDAMYSEFGIGGVFNHYTTLSGIPLYIWQTATTDYAFIENIYPKELESIALPRKYNLTICFRPLREKFRRCTGELTENAKSIINEIRQANSVQKALTKLNAMCNE